MIQLSITFLVVMIFVFVIPFTTGLVMLYAKLTGLHKQINSRMDELVALTRKQALAEGRLEGKEDRAQKGED